MKKYILLLAGVLFCFLAKGQSKSERLLDKVSVKINSFESIYVEFDYILNSYKEKINQNTQGSIKIQRNKYALNYMNIQKKFDGTNTYTIIPDNEEVIIRKEEEESNGITPLKMLTFYKTGYKYKWDITQKVGAKNIQYIELIPLQKDKEIKKILLGIDIANDMIYNIIQTDIRDVRTTIMIKKLVPNAKIEPNTFLFNRNKYEKMGYYIVEE